MGKNASKRVKVFIATSSFAQHDAAPLKLFEDADIDVQVNPHGRTLTADECRYFYRDIDGLIAGTEALTADILSSASNLKVISRCGAGLDNVDLEAAKERGILVFSTPYGPTVAVAELTVALILSLMRHVPRMDREMRSGKWQKRMGHLLRDKKVGIIGFGKIGRKVAELLMGVGAQVAYCDPLLDATKTGCPQALLDELLAWSDIITLHASGKKPLLGKAELDKMKPGSWLVNCARGGVVDEEELYRRLKDGRLSGAAIDVFGKEPYLGPLTELDNVILTPHIGSYAVESRVEMEIESVTNLLQGLAL